MTVFIVSDDAAVQDSLSELVASAGLRAEAFPSLEIWRKGVDPEQRGCLVLDARTHDFSAPRQLAWFASVCATRPVLLLIDRGDVPGAVRAIRDGATDVVEKPYRDEQILERIKRMAVVAQDVT